MSSVTILFVLQAMMHEMQLHQKSKTILAAGFGPGLTLESALIQFVPAQSITNGFTIAKTAMAIAQ
jgi:predicted naringenin-chalcone synthase